MGVGQNETTRGPQVLVHVARHWKLPCIEEAPARWQWRARPGLGARVNMDD